VDQLGYRDSEKFWTPKTSAQLILLLVAVIAFLMGLAAVVSTKLMH
jgi:hypothetical protein